MRGIALVDLPRFSDQRGNLVALEEGNSLPFEVRRVFFMWGVPSSVARGEDAVSCHEALLAVHGSVTIDLDNGDEQATVWLSRPDQAICVHAGVWIRMRDFSPDAIILAVASQRHGETRRFMTPQPELLKYAGAGLWPSIP